MNQANQAPEILELERIMGSLTFKTKSGQASAIRVFIERHPKDKQKELYAHTLENFGLVKTNKDFICKEKSLGKEEFRRLLSFTLGKVLVVEQEVIKKKKSSLEFAGLVMETMDRTLDDDEKDIFLSLILMGEDGLTPYIKFTYPSLDPENNKEDAKVLTDLSSKAHAIERIIKSKRFSMGDGNVTGVVAACLEMIESEKELKARIALLTAVVGTFINDIGGPGKLAIGIVNPQGISGLLEKLSQGSPEGIGRVPSSKDISSLLEKLTQGSSGPFSMREHTEEDCETCESLEECDLPSAMKVKGKIQEESKNGKSH
jgi:hypothetical protein